MSPGDNNDWPSDVDAKSRRTPVASGIKQAFRRYSNGKVHIIIFLLMLGTFSIGSLWGATFNFLFPSSGAMLWRKRTVDFPPVLRHSISLPYSVSNFQSYLELVTWDKWEQAVVEKDQETIEAYTTQAISDLALFAGLEPKVPINESCKTPPPLPEPESINCKAYPKAFKGSKRWRPAKIAHIVQLGFDIDVLEIHLREVADLVDYFFIIEATKAQFKLARKPLMWELVKNQERFLPFRDKVVHLIVDDVDVTPGSSADNSIWYLEDLQERSRWRKFLEWNEKTSYFSNDDVIGFGDTDEIPSRNNLQLLKHCYIEGPVDIGIWFPFGLLNQAFVTDWPVPGHRLSLGDPTFWPIHAAKALKGVTPSRNRGKSGRYLLGGMHMTNPAYLPFLLLKTLSCTECGVLDDPRILKAIAALVKAKDIVTMENKYADANSGADAGPRMVRVKDVKEELKDIAVLPWFYDCNRNRYPYWERNHDTRLD